jgi:adenylate cyclase
VAFVAIPTDAFLGSLKQTVAIVAVLAAIGLAGAIFGSSILAKRVTKPLYAVMNETSRVRELDLKERPLPISGIAEVDELAESVKLMKTSLRSFEKLVPADYARWLMKSGQEAKLEGERRELTIFFADVVGFTRLSEQLGPEELVETLASYFEVLTRAVLREGGTVDKFNGDDVMAFWGAPQVMKDHAERAVRAALSAQTELAALRAEWEAEGIAILDISYGIATGEVIVGNIGNRRRMNYTVIGDAANVASRLEGLNKQLGTSILISNATAGQLSDAFTLRPVENAVIPGRQMSELVWEVLPGAGWSAVAETGRAAWEHEQAGRLEEAKRLYEEGLKLREGDPVSLRALERIARRI